MCGQITRGVDFSTLVSKQFQVSVSGCTKRTSVRNMPIHLASSNIKAGRLGNKYTTKCLNSSLVNPVSVNLHIIK